MDSHPLIPFPFHFFFPFCSFCLFQHKPSIWIQFFFFLGCNHHQHGWEGHQFRLFTYKKNHWKTAILESIWKTGLLLSENRNFITLYPQILINLMKNDFILIFFLPTSFSSPLNITKNNRYTSKFWRACFRRDCQIWNREKILSYNFSHVTYLLK